VVIDNALLLDGLFRGLGDDPLARRAGWPDGVRSVLTGVAAARSPRTGRPVHLTGVGTALAPARDRSGQDDRFVSAAIRPSAWRTSTRTNSARPVQVIGPGASGLACAGPRSVWNVTVPDGAPVTSSSTRAVAPPVAGARPVAGVAPISATPRGTWAPKSASTARTAAKDS
jgi:hypothetical protein